VDIFQRRIEPIGRQRLPAISAEMHSLPGGYEVLGSVSSACESAISGTVPHGACGEFAGRWRRIDTANSVASLVFFAWKQPACSHPRFYCHGLFSLADKPGGFLAHVKSSNSSFFAGRSAEMVKNDRSDGAGRSARDASQVRASLASLHAKNHGERVARSLWPRLALNTVCGWPPGREWQPATYELSTTYGNFSKWTLRLPRLAH